MNQNTNTSILLRLSPEIYEVLETFGAENQFTVPFAAKELFQRAFEQWRNGTIVLKTSEKSRRYFRSGQTQRRHKKTEGQ